MTQQDTSQIADAVQWAILQIRDIAKQTISQIPVKNPMRKAVADIFNQVIADIGQQAIAGITQQTIAVIAQQVNSQFPTTSVKNPKRKAVNSQIPATSVKNPKRKAADTAGKANDEKRCKVR